MLNQIAPASAQPKSEDAVDLLTGCHQRIRHFTAVAVKLAHAHGASPEDIRQAADAVHRYYSVSLPLHEADEDQTLHPRLSPAADEMVRHALLAMGDQHQAIDELIGAAAALAGAGEERSRLAGRSRRRNVRHHQSAGRNLPGPSSDGGRGHLPGDSQPAAGIRPSRDAARNAGTQEARLERVRSLVLRCHAERARGGGESPPSLGYVSSNASCCFRKGES